MHISVENVAYQSSCQYRCWGKEVSQSFSQNQVGFDKQILSYVYICLLPSEVSLQLKILPKNIYKNKCREDEIDTIFNSPLLFTSNALIQFKQPMLAYQEYFNAGVSIYISHITIFALATLQGIRVFRLFSISFFLKILFFFRF